MGRLILWFVLFSFLMRFLRRFAGHSTWTPQGRKRTPPSGSEERSENEAARLARQHKERFEFKKRQAIEAGSMGYIWRTSNDGHCPRHKKLEGRFVPWENPPAEDGVPAHAGELPDCTCTAEIVY